VVTYLVKIQTQSAGASATGQYEIRFTDQGGDKPLVAQYGGLTFEVSRQFVESLSADYVNKAEEPRPTLPPGLGGPGGLGIPGLQ
jgi:hypothetical protein